MNERTIAVMALVLQMSALPVSRGLDSPWPTPDRKCPYSHSGSSRSGSKVPYDLRIARRRAKKR